ncbi:MAG: toll/interleukin-1 receptor domain-containing protein, partial [Planctomycetes bacterium]|nr:toll/interleukin-1 receptor domain-containing protein [Planctomycetota bacterium]
MGFDPYREWLGIPPEEQPPNHYRLLGLKPFEDLTSVIRAAVEMRFDHVRKYTLSGPLAEHAYRTLDEVSAASACLLDLKKKAAYDVKLRDELAARSALPKPSSAGGSSADASRLSGWVSEIASAMGELVGASAIFLDRLFPHFLLCLLPLLFLLFPLLLPLFLFFGLKGVVYALLCLMVPGGAVLLVTVLRRRTRPKDRRSLEPYPRPVSDGVSELDENVQFTVFHDEAIPPAEWCSLSVSAYLDKKRADAPERELEPLERALRKAVQTLRRSPEEIRQSTQPSRRAIPRGDELTFLLEWDHGLSGEVLVESNPDRHVFRWLEDEHTVVFRIRASAALDGKFARGNLTVFLGPILVGDVAIRIPVTSDSPAIGDEGVQLPEIQCVKLYRKIFPSYSHLDSDVVERVENHAEASGDQYLRDCRILRPGDKWNPRILELIKEADIFQLFWSTNSMHSDNVRREWEYALSLGKLGFVRPVYWEDPRPEEPVSRPKGQPPESPPPELDELPFQRISIEPDLIQKSTPRRSQ